jgi:hypothetical protein
MKAYTHVKILWNMFQIFYRSLSVETSVILVLVIFRILDLSCQTFSKIQVLDSSFVYFVTYIA